MDSALGPGSRPSQQACNLSNVGLMRGPCFWWAKRLQIASLGLHGEKGRPMLGLAAVMGLGRMRRGPKRVMGLRPIKNKNIYKNTNKNDIQIIK